MSKDTLIFIGLDTHKEFTEVAYVLDGRGDSVCHHGRIQTTKPALVKLARQFQSKYPKATLHFVYEAGPCGYWIYRLLTSLSHCCYVVAPSLIPKKPGDRVKTDKRDAQMLAEHKPTSHRFTYQNLKTKPYATSHGQERPPCTI